MPMTKMLGCICRHTEDDVSELKFLRNDYTKITFFLKIVLVLIGIIAAITYYSQKYQLLKFFSIACFQYKKTSASRRVQMEYLIS